MNTTLSLEIITGTEITVEVSDGNFDMGAVEVSPGIDLGDISIGALVPVIPRNYGLITYNGSVITVS